MAMALRPDEQARLTVTPEVVIGSPAINAAPRATLPDAATQPATTSSTSDGSTFDRFTACSTACARIAMLDVLLNPPLAAFASPVRAYETTTASRTGYSFRCSIHLRRRRDSDTHIQSLVRHMLGSAPRRNREHGIHLLWRYNRDTGGDQLPNLPVLLHNEHDS